MNPIGSRRDLADVSQMDIKSTKTIRMNTVITAPAKPGNIFNIQKANAALIKAAHFVSGVKHSATLIRSNH